MLRWRTEYALAFTLTKQPQSMPQQRRESAFDYRHKQDSEPPSGGDPDATEQADTNILTFAIRSRSFVLRNAFEFVILARSRRSP